MCIRDRCVCVCVCCLFIEARLHLYDVETGGRRDREVAKPEAGKAHRHRRHRKHQQQQPGAVTSRDDVTASSSVDRDVDHRNAERPRRVDVADVALPTSQYRVAGVNERFASRAVVTYGWRGSRVVSVLDSGAEGPGFKSQPRRYQVTVLGN